MFSTAAQLRHSYAYEEAFNKLFCLRYDGRASSLVELAIQESKNPLSRHGRSQLISPAQYEAVIKKRRDLELAEEHLFNVSCSILKEEEHPQKKKRKKRSCKTLSPYFFDKHGNQVFLKPEETPWYLMYVTGHEQVSSSPKFALKFRRRFRMPHSEYLKLLDQVSLDDMFKRWFPTNCDATGRPPSPIGLLLLGSLRYLGRGLTFDDLEEFTAIGEETHRQFFHVFIEWGTLVLFPMHVKRPANAAEYSLHQHEFNVGGLHGAAFSSDATNVIMWRCSHNLRQAHMGFKNSHPARTYNLTTNHRRQILYTTKGHASRWNDKTLVLFDEFLSGIHEGKILQDVLFHLEEKNHDGTTIKRAYRGAWGLVDNGYHKWTCTQAPAKFDSMVSAQKLSEWIESFRKDAECVFGILKGRFRCLQTGIRVHGVEAADRIWFTCCALHNLLLDADGLSAEWTGVEGQNDPEEIRRLAPFAIRRLAVEQMRTFGSREHEKACRINTAQFLDCIVEEEEEEDNDGGAQFDAYGARFINSMAYDDFREKLVSHFDILRKRREVKWPVRSDIIIN